MNLLGKKATLILISAHLFVVLCGGVNARPEHTSLVQEIASVSITDDEGADSSLFKNIDLNDDDIIVTFRYGKNNPSRDSIFLTKPNVWRPGKMLQLGGLVNSHVVTDPTDQETLFCEVKKKGKPLFFAGSKAWASILDPPTSPDRILATAEFKSEDLRSCKDEDSIKTELRSIDGSSIRGSFLEIDIIQKHWKDMYANSKIEEKSKMEKFFRLMGKFFRNTLENTNNLKAWELEKPVDAANPDLKLTPLSDTLNMFSFPENDEFDPVPSSVTRVFDILNKMKFLDTLTQYANRAAGIFDIRQKVGRTIAHPKEGRWKSPTLDASMKRVYFSSVGMFFVEKVPGFEQGYVADLTDLQKYEVRNGEHEYSKYGCKTYFDENGNIVKIEDLDGTMYFPGKPFWEWAKLKSRTAAFTKAAFVHVAAVHYCWGNIAATSLRMYLPPEHPLRRAFRPHFYKTHHTCKRAQKTLFDKSGLLFRGLAMEYKTGLEQAFVDYISNFTFARFPDDLQQQKVTDCKFHVGANDGLDLHKILCKYVSDLVDETYSDQEALDADLGMKRTHEYLVENFKISKEANYTLENVKTIWGEIIFRVTGFHNSVGAVTAFALDPAMTNIRLQPKHYCESTGFNLVACKEAAQGVAFISAITQVPCPTLGQCWKQVLENPECKAYANLRANLNDLENTIIERNKVRDANVDFKPSCCAISISS